MTTWAAKDVAEFARQANWPSESLPIAVAVALAASDGDDHAHVTVPGVPDGDWRGLWLARGSLVHGEPPDALYDPRTAARAARALCGDSGTDWAWSEVWRAGSYRARLGEAEAALRGDAADVTIEGLASPTDVGGAVAALVGTARRVTANMLAMRRFTG